VSKKVKEHSKYKIVNGYKVKVRGPIVQKIKGFIPKRGNGLNVKHKAFFKKQAKTSSYYMFCDQDDFWLMDKVFLTVKKLRKLEHKRKHKPCMVFTDAILVDEKLKFVDKSFYKTNHMNAGKCDLGHLLMENKAVGCTVAVNQAAADVLELTYPSGENGFKFRNDYDYIRYHDWWMALICSAFGRVKFYHVPTVMYRQHSENQVGQTSFNKYVKNRAATNDINNRILKTIGQAECFYRCYGHMLKKSKLKTLSCFIKLKEYNPVMKRLIMFRHGFFKSGIIRNIALLIAI